METAQIDRIAKDSGAKIDGIVLALFSGRRGHRTPFASTAKLTREAVASFLRVAYNCGEEAGREKSTEVLAALKDAMKWIDIRGIPSMEKEGLLMSLQAVVDRAEERHGK